MNERTKLKVKTQTKASGVEVLARAAGRGGGQWAATGARVGGTEAADNMELVRSLVST